MYTIEVNSEWRAEFGSECYPMFFYIVRNENGEIVFENDWDFGSPNRSCVENFMETYFPGVQFSIEGDI